MQASTKLSSFGSHTDLWAKSLRADKPEPVRADKPEPGQSPRKSRPSKTRSYHSRANSPSKPPIASDSMQMSLAGTSTPDLYRVVRDVMNNQRKNVAGNRDTGYRDKQKRFQNTFTQNTQLIEVTTDDTRPRVVMSAIDPMRAAFYNVTMSLFCICCLMALAGSYFLFYDFVKPALWAVICGIVLYPLKRLMTTVVQTYLDVLANTNTPLIMGLAFTPIRVLDAIGDQMLSVLITQRFAVGILVCTIPFFSLIINYELIPRTIVLLRRIMTGTDWILQGFTGKWALVPLAIYLSIIVASSFIRSIRSIQGFHHLRHDAVSASLWLLTIAHLCGYLGPLRSLGFFLTLGLYGIYWRNDLTDFWHRVTNKHYPTEVAKRIRSRISGIGSNAWQSISNCADRCGNILEDSLMPAVRVKITQLQTTLGVTPLKSPKLIRSSSSVDETSERSAEDKEDIPVTPLSRPTGLPGSSKAKNRWRSVLNKELKQLITAPDSTNTSGAGSMDDNRSTSSEKTFSEPGSSVDEAAKPEPDTGYHSPADHESSPLHRADADDADTADGGGDDDDRYIKYLLLACFFVYVSTRLYLITLLSIPLLFAVIKRLAYSFELMSIIRKCWRLLLEHCSADADILIPGPIRSLWKYGFQLDKKIIGVMRASMDMVGSLSALIVMLVLIGTIWFFVTMQIYYESMHMITLASQVAHHMMEHNAKFRDWILNYTGGDNSTSVTELLQGQAHRLYHEYGETWISSQIKELVHGNETQADILEQQVKGILGGIYSSLNEFVVTNPSTADVSDKAVAPLGVLMDFNSAGDIMDIIYDNFLTVFEVFNSAWSIVVENAELVLGSVGGLLTTVLESGSAVMDFVLDTTVFLTILFGLLTSSGQQFKPLEVLQYLSPSKEGALEIARDIEDAVSGIFLATLKMALFYGMFTWLTHTIFAVNLIFLPSVLAAIFAAIPFFGPTLVTIPAMLELWLIRGEPFLAFLLFVIHNIPSYFVDDAIYSGIKFCDPFLTGMSIAGGMLWWGLEGAIFGPILLCIYLVILSIYENLITIQMRQHQSQESNPNTSMTGDQGLSPLIDAAT